MGCSGRAAHLERLPSSRSLKSLLARVEGGQAWARPVARSPAPRGRGGGADTLVVYESDSGAFTVAVQLKTLTLFFLTYPILSCPILSYPGLSYRSLSYPILTYPTYLSCLKNKKTKKKQKKRKIIAFPPP